MSHKSLVTVLGGTSAPLRTPIMPHSCTAVAGSCTIKCAGGVHYDLSKLKPASPSAKDTHAKDGDLHDYYWRTCDEAHFQQDCGTSTVKPKSSWAAVQTWPDGSGGKGCAVIGDVTKATCTAADSNNPDKGVQCVYTGGDGTPSRQVTFRWLCAQSPEEPKITAPKGGSSYTITIHDPAGCAAHGPSPAPGPGPAPSPQTPAPPPPPHMPSALEYCDMPAVEQRSSGCTYRCGHETYDLSSLLSWTGGSVTAADADGAVYHWAVCSQWLAPSHMCNKTAVTAPGATRYASGSCETIGVWRDAYCRLRDSTNPKSGLHCAFRPLPGGSSLDVECDPHPKPNRYPAAPSWTSSASPSRAPRRRLP